MKRKLFALPQEQIKAFRESRKELLSLVKTMSADDIKNEKEDFIKNAAINDIKRAKERNGGGLFDVVNNIAIIPVEGFLAQEVDICTLWFGGNMTTYPYVRAATAEADADPDINAIVYMHDSGGGLVDGVDQTAQAIAETKKPTFAFISNVCASADYWLASQADHVATITQSALIGSIGVAVSWIDRSGADEKEGFKEETLTSTPATKKRPDMKTDEGRAVIIKELDDLHEVFVNSIVSARPGLTAKKINSTAGGVLIAEDAKSLGLIDDVIKESEMMSYIESKLKTPAGAGKVAQVAENKTEVMQMTPKEMLDQNPAAKIERDKQLDDMYKAGVIEGKKEMTDVIAKVAPIMKSDAYLKNGVVKNAAFEVLAGNKSFDYLDATVAYVDAQVESESSEAAKKEDEKLGETQPSVVEGAEINGKLVQDELKSMRRR